MSKSNVVSLPAVPTVTVSEGPLLIGTIEGASEAEAVEIGEKFQEAYAVAAFVALTGAFPGCNVKYNIGADGTLRPFVVVDAPIPGDLTPEETAHNALRQAWDNTLANFKA